MPPPRLCQASEGAGSRGAGAGSLLQAGGPSREEEGSSEVHAPHQAGDSP